MLTLKKLEIPPSVNVHLVINKGISFNKTSLVTVHLCLQLWLVMLMQFNLCNVVPTSDTLPMKHPVYINI
jgi:hypothetical protein